MRGKSKNIFVAFIIGMGLTLSLLWQVGQIQFTHADPVILYVALDGNDANDCASETNRCQTVQHAVDVAQPGDDIRVAGGTYAGVSTRAGITQVAYISKTVTIRGSYTTTNWTTPNPTANPTTLDAQGKGRVLVIRDAGPTIEGFIITGGGGDFFSGGGINVENASPTVRDNQIIGNSANGDGGAIWVNRGSAQISHNHIINNSAVWGAGLRIINNADVRIVGNQIMSNTAQIAGGGIHLECCGGFTPFIAQNFIANNNGGARGGGVIVKTTRVRLINNILVSNQAISGAGLWFEGMASYPVSATLIHNTLVGPLGGEAVWGGSYVTATLVNNIIVSNTVGITNTAPASSTVTADHTLFNSNATDYGSGVSSTNEVHGDPVFIAPDAGDYHIGSGSAAIDKGVNAGVNNDIDGDFRPIGAGFDIGADEFLDGFYWRIYLPLLHNN